MENIDRLIDRYECSCASGYELDKDRHTCHLREKDMDGGIYVSLAGEVRLNNEEL